MIILIFKAKSDEIEKTKNKLLGNLKKIGGKVWKIVIKAKDMTKRVISSILGKLKQVEKRPYQGSINLKDMVSSAMGRILPKLMLFKNTFGVV